MEKRRLVKLGRSTLVLSMPVDWVRSNRLKPGDTVLVYVQEDGSLVICPREPNVARELETTIYIDQTERESKLAREILSCYLNGYTTIRVVSKKVFSVEQQKTIRRLAQKLYMGIMDASSSEMVLQSLLDLSKIQLDASLRRMHSITYSMFKDSMRALENYDQELATAVISLDDEVDNFSYLLQRLLRTTLMYPHLMREVRIGRVDCLDSLVVVQSIENIADNIVSIARKTLILIEENKRLPGELLEPLLRLGEECMKYYDEAFNAFVFMDVDRSNNLLDSREMFGENNLKILRNLSKQSDPTIICATCSINSNLQAIITNASRIAEAAIDRCMYMRKQISQSK